MHFIVIEEADDRWLYWLIYLSHCRIIVIDAMDELSTARLIVICGLPYFDDLDVTVIDGKAL